MSELSQEEKDELARRLESFLSEFEKEIVKLKTPELQEKVLIVALCGVAQIGTTVSTVIIGRLEVAKFHMQMQLWRPTAKLFETSVDDRK